ncbi:serine aminopeptidase S33 family [Anoxybacillus vitaminiphilus]|uniref:Serine aminopeptidase S33 family n=1 Tax=Paranoxybacillus vitaminiphilus TaxID=581036 RepID=A0A327YQV0_9BACL|nr:alpha/beta hydrolase [Anoxybacillus vitaminiphilus]RAK23524.1 serine aminopeptidase S33 family [Anoxybacillus vitaminiphilus]
MNSTVENKTIKEALMTALLFDGFWDRWIAHGVRKEDLQQIRSRFVSIDGWTSGWTEQAENKQREADLLEKNGQFPKAIEAYKTAALYYQLAQWIYSVADPRKKDYLQKSVQLLQKADRLADYRIQYEKLLLGDSYCRGRILFPIATPLGVVIMLNPIDSAKEELYSYEHDFVSQGFVVLNFDGPGQGETLLFEGQFASRANWEMYVAALMNLAKTQFADLPVFVFGTSSGAAWTVYVSQESSIKKAVSVSPAFADENKPLPPYFVNRFKAVTAGSNFIPNIKEVNVAAPVMLVHGKQDVLVSDENMRFLYNQLPNGKRWIEYEEEGHCCNFKLGEIRMIASKWFKEGDQDDIGGI